MIPDLTGARSRRYPHILQALSGCQRCVAGNLGRARACPHEQETPSARPESRKLAAPAAGTSCCGRGSGLRDRRTYPKAFLKLFRHATFNYCFLPTIIWMAVGLSFFTPSPCSALTTNPSFVSTVASATIAGQSLETFSGCTWSTAFATETIPAIDRPDRVITISPPFQSICFQPASSRAVSNSHKKSACSGSLPADAVSNSIPENRLICDEILEACIGSMRRGALNVANSNCALAACALASAVSFRNCSACVSSSAIFSFEVLRSDSQYSSLTLPIQITATVATTPTARLPTNTRLATLNMSVAVDSDGHIRIPPWFPLSAIAIVVVAAVVGIIALLRNL